MLFNKYNQSTSGLTRSYKIVYFIKAEITFSVSFRQNRIFQPVFAEIGHESAPKSGRN